MSILSLIKRPEINYQAVIMLLDKNDLKLEISHPNLEEVLEQVEIEVKYSGYIKKAIDQSKKMRNYDEKKIPSDINYDEVDNIALEAREKFKKIKPTTVGQASRISGVNPADISVLVVYLEKLQRMGR